MKKTVSNLLVTINVAVVVLLLIASAILIFMANAQQNYQVKLITGETIDDKIGEKCLIILNINNTNKIQENSQLLISMDDANHMITVDKFESNIVSYTGETGESLTIDITTQAYLGRITFSSNFLGGLVSILADKDTLSLRFIFIGGVFILALLSLTIIYAIYRSKKGPISELDDVEEMQLFDEDEPDDDYDDYVFGEAPLDDSDTIDAVDKSHPIIVGSPLSKKLALDSYYTELAGELQPNLLESEDIAYIEKAEDIHTMIKRYEKAMATEQKETAIPPYYLLDDDVPSIDSLMSSIDSQFGFSSNEKETQDVDIKIFSSKK